MAVNITPKGFSFSGRRPDRLDKRKLLDQTNVDFIPLNGVGLTQRTSPDVEDKSFDKKENYIRAARIMMYNPLCFMATKILADAISDADLIVKEKQGNTWVKHENNPLDYWLDEPNDSMDRIELLKSYITHFVNFGKTQIVMFQKGDVLPNGDIAQRNNLFEPVFPTRVEKDTRFRNSQTYLYEPMYAETLLTLKAENVFVDVMYNPTAYEKGISLPNSPLAKVFEIDQLYLLEIHKLFVNGMIPPYLLKYMVDIRKDSQASTDVTEEVIEEKVQQIYRQVSDRGRAKNGILGLRGDWKLERIGTPLKDLLNKDLVHHLQTLVSGVYGIPPSIFWAGLAYSNQRASRQMDSTDFYERTIHPLLSRIENRLGKYLIPKFLNSKWREKFKLFFDVSNMPLAQIVKLRDNREAERWYQQGIIKRGEIREKLGLSLDGLTEEEKNSYYEASSLNLNVGKGDQSTEDMNGLE